MKKSVIRILLIKTHNGIGGIERIAINFAVAYSKQPEFRVGFLNLAGDSKTLDLIHKSEIDFLTSVKEAIDWKPDLIHIHRHGGIGEKIITIAKTIKDVVGCKVIEKNSFAWPDYSKNRYVVDCNTVLSKWCLWKWLKWTNNLSSFPPVKIVPNLLNVELFRKDSDLGDQCRKEYNIPKNAFVVGRVGSPIEAKWHRYVVDSFAALAKQASDTYLILVGPPKSIIAAVGNLPSGIRERVIEIDRVSSHSELNGIYNAMNVFCHTAEIGESFGNVIAESMLVEIPVVSLSTPIRSNTQIELVDHEVNGIIVNDLVSLSDALRSLYFDRKKLELLKEKCRAKITDNFSEKVVMEKMKSIISGLINSKVESDTVSSNEIFQLLRNSSGRFKEKLVKLSLLIINSYRIYHLRSWLKFLMK